VTTKHSTDRAQAGKEPAEAQPPFTLVCFAVREEAGPFQKIVRGRAGVKVLITGMGRQNTLKNIKAALEERPTAVLTCGFAGGLNPELEAGTVVFFAPGENPWKAALLEVGARRAKFHCAERVAVTVAEKQRLWQTTGADAVEMESGCICEACREQHIPVVVLRVILDAAADDLPLDFNLLLTKEQRLDPAKMAMALAKAPTRLPALLRLQKQSRLAAEALAASLARLIEA
jgi:adenosylhomocysteine nucleosidase